MNTQTHADATKTETITVAIELQVTYETTREDAREYAIQRAVGEVGDDIHLAGTHPHVGRYSIKGIQKYLVTKTQSQP